MTPDPAHDAIIVRLDTVEGEVDSLRQARHDNANHITILQERVMAIASEVEGLRRSVERTADESRRQTQELHDGLLSITNSITLLKPAVDKLHMTLLGTDDDGGVKSRVVRMENSVEEISRRIVWIQRIGFGLVALLGPEQLKHLFSMVFGR